MSRSQSLALVAGVGLAIACGDSPLTGPGEPVPVASVTLDRASASLVAGQQIQLTATPRDDAGRPVGGRTVAWASSDATVASVSPAGVVTAHREDTATITATVDAKSATAKVVVRADDAYDLVHSGWPDLPFGDWRLFRRPLGGGPSEPVIPPDLLPDFGFNRPAVSPDGRRIAFIGWRTDDPGPSYIFVAEADGSGVRQVTAGGLETQPTWSPDGSRIAYVVRRRAGRDADIWVMNADGSAPLNLTAGAGPVNQYSPAWSPEMPGGSRIVYGEGDENFSSLWSMRPDGSDRRRITDAAGRDDDPAWSPDGSRIAFMRWRPGVANGFDIWVSDATGSNAAPLVSLPEVQASPAWSPDGRLIAFTSFHAGPLSPFVLYTVQSDGTGLTRRTTEAWWSDQPTFGVSRRAR